MPLIRHLGKLLRNPAGKLASVNCCCGICCGCGRIDSLDTLIIAFSGAVTGEDVLTADGASGCKSYSNPVIPLDDTCGGEILFANAALICPEGADSVNDLLVAISGGGGACAFGSWTLVEATCTPLYLRFEGTVEELFEDGCPCGDGELVTVEIME